MLRAIFYKEYLKLRLVWPVLLLLHIGVVVYLLLALRATLLTSGVVETWATMIGRDVLMVGLLMYVPLLSGIAVALCQWLPEMQNKRIKLTLHLPVDYTVTIGAMLLCGLFGLCLICCLDAIILAVVESLWLPRELVWRTLLTCLPWYIGGLMAYAITSWCVLEPQWRIRCLDLCIGAPLVALCYLTSQPACYSAMWPWLVVLLLIAVCLPFYSVYRFKLGKQ